VSAGGTADAAVAPDRINLLTSVPFFGIHLAALAGALLVDFRPSLLVWMFLSYVIRMWAITAGYHRYFSHRSYDTSRVFQFLLGLLGTLALQKGPLWWAAHHRWHHQHGDEDVDIHSPMIRGLFWAHMGWILCDKYKDTEWSRIDDLAHYPELRLLNRFSTVPPIIAGAAVWIFAGPAMFVWAGLVATVLEWHTLFIANSLCHMFGWKRYPTSDNGRNNPFFALLLLGEGWHNNHHYYPGAARQGFFWWELDPTYYSIRFFQFLGLVRNVREVPPRVLVAGSGGDS
jgi:stearoyl-CoA desaturase (delta-9 desaturase)